MSSFTIGNNPAMIYLSNIYHLRFQIMEILESRFNLPVDVLAGTFIYRITYTNELCTSDPEIIEVPIFLQSIKIEEYLCQSSIKRDKKHLYECAFQDYLVKNNMPKFSIDSSMLTLTMIR